MPFVKLERNNTYDCLWPYILRILREKPMHAYVLRAETERRFGFRPGNVTAYRVLYSLRKKGYVEKTKDGMKQVYNITPKGKKLLKDAARFYRDRARMLR
ncbi:MAG: helix-turn-helix transcriptional regulator [Candidatus Aenigmatarchaeota archaeon]